MPPKSGAGTRSQRSATGRGRQATATTPSSQQTATGADLEKKRADPLDFETLPLPALRKYRQVHKLQVPSPKTIAGFMLEGNVGKKTLSAKHNMRIAKSEVAADVKRHFMNQTVRESECIVDFIYSVRRQDKAFKMQFS